VISNNPEQYISAFWSNYAKAMLPLPLNAMVRTATHGLLPIAATALPRWNGNRERTKDAEQELERILNPHTPSTEQDARASLFVIRLPQLDTAKPALDAGKPNR
jgi:hypothetical protein